MVRDQEPAVCRYAPRDGTNVMSRLRPFYAIGPDYYYRQDRQDLGAVDPPVPGIYNTPLAKRAF